MGAFLSAEQRQVLAKAEEDRMSAIGTHYTRLAINVPFGNGR